MEENVKFPSYSPSNEISKETHEEDLDRGLRQKGQRKKAAKLKVCLSGAWQFCTQTVKASLLQPDGDKAKVAGIYQPPRPLQILNLQITRME